MILSGELGEVNAVRAFYIQGWLRTKLEAESQKQASWRTDPKKSGAAGCFGNELNAGAFASSNSVGTTSTKCAGS